MIDVASCRKVIKRIEDDVELLEPWHIEPAIGDVGVICLELCVGAKLLRNFFRDLEYKWRRVRQQLEGGVYGCATQERCRKGGEEGEDRDHALELLIF